MSDKQPFGFVRRKLNDISREGLLLGSFHNATGQGITLISQAFADSHSLKFSFTASGCLLFFQQLCCFSPLTFAPPGAPIPALRTRPASRHLRCTISPLQPLLLCLLNCTICRRLPSLLRTLRLARAPLRRLRAATRTRPREQAALSTVSSPARSGKLLFKTLLILEEVFNPPMPVLWTWTCSWLRRIPR